jgi:hypothetical protein
LSSSTDTHTRNDGRISGVIINNVVLGIRVQIRSAH